MSPFVSSEAGDVAALPAGDACSDGTGDGVIPGAVDPHPTSTIAMLVTAAILKPAPPWTIDCLPAVARPGRAAGDGMVPRHP